MLLLAALFALALPVLAADPSERFNLYTGCTKMRLAASFAAVPGEEIAGLNGREIRDAVQPLLSDMLGDGPNQLQIGVRVAGGAAVVWVFFLKLLDDPLSGEAGAAVSWSRVSVGLWMNSPEAVLAAVRFHVGEFVQAYRAENREACEAA